jgi:hypothetical protein
MVEKFDSAIFVIGGPCRIYQALNYKAENLFTHYLDSIRQPEKPTLITTKNLTQVEEEVHISDQEGEEDPDHHE